MKADLTKRTTIRDVAKASGVSVFTVSMVLNKKGRISDETRQNVLRVARKLNYNPLKNMPLARNATAKALALVVPSLYAEMNPFYWPAIATARRVASEAGYDFKLFTEPTLTKRLSNKDDTLLAMGFEGLIVFCCDPPASCIKKIIDARIPVAAVRRKFDIPGLVHILDRDADGMRLAMEHLHQTHGHKRIAIMTPREGGSVLEERYNSYISYLKSHRLPHNKKLCITYINIDKTPINEIAELARSGKMTALICMDDLQAIYVAKGLMRLGLRVPDDIAIVGYNNTIGAELFHPGLTSVQIPVADMIRAASHAVRDYDFNSKSTRITHSFQQTLVIRESCGCKATPDQPS